LQQKIGSSIEASTILMPNEHRNVNTIFLLGEKEEEVQQYFVKWKEERTQRA